jgi:hypothetical protein
MRSIEPGISRFSDAQLHIMVRSLCSRPGMTVSLRLEHDPEKWTPVFPRDKRGTRLRGDHAQTKKIEVMTIRRKVISL